MLRIDFDDPHLDGDIRIDTRDGPLIVTRRRWLARFGSLELLPSLTALCIMQDHAGDRDAARAAFDASPHFTDREHATRIAFEVVNFVDELRAPGGLH